MEFKETAVAGAFVVAPERLDDERGFFARTFCRREFAQRGLNPQVSQSSVSFNPKRGTLRGLHYQAPPHAECKLVRCTRGAIFDVIIDLRPHSPSYRRWAATELSAQNHRLIYIPEGIAHGFLTLADDCEVFYEISESYHPECTRGVRWNDPAFHVRWPFPPALMSERDRSYPDFAE
ncbi:MAG TPA: dTDP-4-dehydrorhamnose 3,5-epimerase [Candidatus Binataceae bacterium]|jgi:dTDP-4-dehydrorhamnose 3,5-epimerase|nr:dTDP-4-dehydrorhamnose 3,5-epimerase [Candidatus Binataceae bacterium]